MAEYSKAFIMQYLRKQKNMTQEELSEGICDPVTLSRYENGNLNPSEDKYNRIMEKLGYSGETYIFPIQTEGIYVEEKMEKILLTLEKEELVRTRELVEELKKTVSFSYKENQQYIGRIEAILDKKEGKVDDEGYIDTLVKLMRLTFAEFTVEHNIQPHIYTESELLLSHSIASWYKEKGKLEEACSIYQALENYYDTVEVIRDFKPKYLILVSHSNILGLQGKHKESISLCEKGIKWLKEQGICNYLYNFYYNMGWNLIKMAKDRKEIEQGRRYIWLSYQLCELYPENKRNLERIKKYYESIPK